MTKLSQLIEYALYSKTDVSKVKIHKNDKKFTITSYSKDGSELSKDTAKVEDDVSMEKVLDSTVLPNEDENIKIVENSDGSEEVVIPVDNKSVNDIDKNSSGNKMTKIKEICMSSDYTNDEKITIILNLINK